MIEVNVLFSRENLKMFWSIPAINQQNTKMASLNISCLHLCLIQSRSQCFASPTRGLVGQDALFSVVVSHLHLSTGLTLAVVSSCFYLSHLPVNFYNGHKTQLIGQKYKEQRKIRKNQSAICIFRLLKI